MAIVARLRWALALADAGHCIRIASGFVHASGKMKIKVFVGSQPDIVPPLLRPSVRAVLEEWVKAVSERLLITMDRGHRHSLGHSTFALWISGPAASSGGTTAGAAPPPDDKTNDDDEDGFDSRDGPADDSSAPPDPWCGGQDPWSSTAGPSSGTAAPLPKRPRRHGSVRPEHVKIFSDEDAATDTNRMLLDAKVSHADDAAVPSAQENKESASEIRALVAQVAQTKRVEYEARFAPLLAKAQAQLPLADFETMQREILLQIDDVISTAEPQLISDYLRKTANASRPSPSYRHPPKFKKKKVSFAVEEEVIPFQVGSAVASLSALEDPCASVTLRPFGRDIVGGHLQVQEPMKTKKKKVKKMTPFERSLLA